PRCARPHAPFAPLDRSDADVHGAGRRDGDCRPPRAPTRRWIVTARGSSSAPAAPRVQVRSGDVTALAAGAIFGAGLVVSGMTRPSRILAFLDLAGDWDPSLMFVMVGAIAAYAVASRAIRRRGAPLFAAE